MNSFFKIIFENIETSGHKVAATLLEIGERSLAIDLMSRPGHKHSLVALVKACVISGDMELLQELYKHCYKPSEPWFVMGMEEGIHCVYHGEMEVIPKISELYIKFRKKLEEVSSSNSENRKDSGPWYYRPGKFSEKDSPLRKEVEKNLEKPCGWEACMECILSTFNGGSCGGGTDPKECPILKDWEEKN